ncbi:MAG: FAD-dependent oxidoreductase [Acidobacteria bacterium]|nr:FAD-dependent oxidoreductase [Acidobacteriota bacterium]
MRSVSCRRRVGAGLTLLSLVLAGCAGRVSPLARADRSAAEPTYDVIVVGAGLAGLTTGQSLVRAEYTVLVLEASGRIGGRAITDATTFPVPVDLGAAWIHGANTNPLTSLVDWLGFTRVPTNLDGEVFIGSHRLTAEEADEFGHDYERTEATMAESPDVAASEFLPERLDFRALIAANIGPLESGAEIDRTSSADAAAFEADPDDFVREGIGTLVARIGRDLPVQLDSPVTAISYGGELDRGVVVATRSGQRYRGRRVVITVSTGVLAADGITFHPELPAWKLQAIRELPMGLLNKVVFEFDGDVLAGEGANEWVLYQQPDPPADVASEVMAFVIKPLGANLAIGFYGAEQARRF